eukprot:Lithocolla_globosa_v1_NODE_3054_length_1780_cov_23.123478.p2 type:complete len:176 gc:universal NODE_3054_length_1780_cov_23.123478:1309-782(-)
MLSAPPILAIPSFFKLMVNKSQCENISFTIAGIDISWQPSSNILMNQAFSANLQASSIKGTSKRSQMALTSLMCFKETGCPAAVLFVIVSNTKGQILFSDCCTRSKNSNRRSMSIAPLKGLRVGTSSSSNSSVSVGENRLMGKHPLMRQFASVVSKKPLDGITKVFPVGHTCFIA